MKQKITYSANFKRNYVAFFAVLFFFLMIAAEVTLAFSIPAYMRRENVLADRVQHREMLLHFDQLRRQCNAIKPKSETIEMEKQLVAYSLDQMAIYLRDEADNLTPAEVDELNELFDSMSKIIDQLAKGKSFSNENRLNTAAYVNSLVKKYPVKGKK